MGFISGAIEDYDKDRDMVKVKLRDDTITTWMPMANSSGGPESGFQATPKKGHLCHVFYENTGKGSTLACGEGDQGYVIMSYPKDTKPPGSASTITWKSNGYDIQINDNHTMIKISGYGQEIKLDDMGIFLKASKKLIFKCDEDTTIKSKLVVLGGGDEYIMENGTDEDGKDAKHTIDIKGDQMTVIGDGSATKENILAPEIEQTATTKFAFWEAGSTSTCYLHNCFMPFILLQSKGSGGLSFEGKGDVAFKGKATMNVGYGRNTVSFKK